MPNVTSVTITNGVPTAGSGTVSTLDALMADGGQATIGAKADAKAAQTDTTAISAMSVWKQISASVQSLVTNLGTLTFTSTRLLVRGEPRAFIATGTQLVAVGGATAYSANDSISNSATIGSVIALPFTTVSDTNDDPVLIRALRLKCSSTAMGAKNVRAYIYNSDPTANNGVVGGDNAAFSNKGAGLVGTMIGLFIAMQDGSFCTLVPENGFEVESLPASGAKGFWYQLQAIDGVTLASSTTFDSTLIGLQARA